MTSPKEWSEHTKFTVTIGTLFSVIIFLISSTVWLTRKMDAVVNIMQKAEVHMKNDWTLPEEIAQFKNQRLLTPNLNLIDPRETWRETHEMGRP